MQLRIFISENVDMVSAKETYSANSANHNCTNLGSNSRFWNSIFELFLVFIVCWHNGYYCLMGVLWPYQAKPIFKKVLLYYCHFSLHLPISYQPINSQGGSIFHFSLVDYCIFHCCKSSKKLKPPQPK